MPAARDDSVATTETTTGPAALPASLITRHTDRNGNLPSAGATSAPSVIMMPEPIPLPTLISIASTVSMRALCASGSAIMLAPMINIAGTAMNSRPCRSMTFPDG